MDEHMARLDKIDPTRLAAGFRELARQTNLSAVECVRNKQIEPRARATHGDQIGRASRRERVGKSVYISGGPDSLHKKTLFIIRHPPYSHSDSSTTRAINNQD